MRQHRSWRDQIVLLPLFLLAPITGAITLNIDDRQSIVDAASSAAYGMMIHYSGNETGQIPGKIPNTWWEGGAMFMALIEYWYYTGDTTYNNEVSTGMQWQSGAGDYMPSNYSTYIGNDDQMFWGLAAMTAAELNFPEVSGGYSWLSLAQGVYNTQIARWDAADCGGGMRWQIWSWESGYTMKNSISNGGLFQLAARLARYTNNATYADWAEKIWDWSTTHGLVDTSTWAVADSVSIGNNCSEPDHTRWTYNYGTFLMGAAYMYNYTNGSSTWLTPVNGLMNSTFSTFASATYNNTLTDIQCETSETCDNNEILFKGLTAGWLAFTAIIVPSTYNTIIPALKISAQSAAEACTGYNNNTCGVRWSIKSWDGWIGLEESMSTTNVFWANLVPYNMSSGPVTSTTGGNSTSNPSAGTTDKTNPADTQKPITTADRAGAGIITALFSGSMVAGVYWLITSD